MSRHSINSDKDPNVLHQKSNSAGQLSPTFTSHSLMSIQSNAATIRQTAENRTSLVEIAHIQKIAKLIRSHKDLANPDGQGNAAGVSIIPSRSNANFIVPETRESAVTQLRELPPVEIPLSGTIIKKKNLGTPSLQIFSKNVVVEDKVPQRSNTADEPPIRKDITKMEPKDVALGLYNQTLAGYNRENVFPLIGKLDPFNNAVLIEYCNLYDFKNISLDNCLRTLCDHVELKGETQIIDRVLYQISRRYWDCNPEMKLVYKSVGKFED